jgi:sensor domain CHASE-containing protein
MCAIDREIKQITTIVTDWAHWTDTYKYIKGEHADYEADNLDLDNTLSALGMNFLGYYDTAGNTVWSRAEDLESGNQIYLGQLTGTELPGNHPLMQHKTLKTIIKGIMPTEQGPLLIVAEPILTSDGLGPIAGTLMMGRFLNDAAIQRIGDLTKLSIAIKTVSEHKTLLNQTSPSNASPGLVYTEFNMVETPKNWQVQTTIADIFNNPILILQIDTPRDISGQGTKAVEQSLWVLAATGMLVMLVLWKLLQQAILKPLAKLTDHALRIGEDDNYTTRLQLEREDEVGVLAHTFDQMIDRLTETRQRLVDQSYHSGIAEMASGVLHNIGNAITPLNVRLATLHQEMRTAPLEEMDMAATELADPSTPSERRGDLQQFVTLAGTEMASLIKESQKSLEISIQQVGQVQEILTDQQRFSRSARVIEPVDMVALIQKAETGLVPDMKNLLGITINDSVAECGFIAGVRAALQQVITNLLINAAESIQSTKTRPGRVTISAEKKVVQGKPMVELCFEDNGAGIDPEHQKTLFERGFSTKNRDGSGYGLHWSANTLQALGGQLTAKSSGMGGGASLFVLLPAAENITQKTQLH